MLKLKLTKQYPNFKLSLDCEIEPAFTALFGPSGAGKTTTLNLIAGLQQPTQGEITLGDRILYSSADKIHLPPQQRKIGYIFQESRLFPHLSVRKNLLFGYRHLPVAARRFTFAEIVAATEVTPFLDRMPGNLSGGEKQRVALARALLAAPDYLLMDEPLAALDSASRYTFLNYIKQIHTAFALPILYVSHDLSSVINFADKVLVLKDGTNVGYGSPYQLLNKIATAALFTAEDIFNIIEAEVLSASPDNGMTIIKAGKLEIILPYLNCKQGEKLLLNIPASEIIVSKHKPEGLSAHNIFAGQITNIYRLEKIVLLEVNCGLNFNIEVIPAAVTRLNLKTGDIIYLIIKAISFKRWK